MAAALVEVDEVQVEATRGEPDGVKVRPEVIKLPTSRIYLVCQKHLSIEAIKKKLMRACKVRITDPFIGPHSQTKSQRT